MKTLIKKGSIGLGVFLILTFLLGFTPSIAEAAYTNLIPAMTSNTAPSGIASASSERRPAWKAFDNKNEYRGWWESSTVGEAWVAYEFTTPKVVKKYSFISMLDYDSNAVPPTLYNFEASNDGTNWTLLDSRDLTGYWEDYDIFKTVTFEVNNQQAYKKYRIRGLNVPGNLCIDSIEMYGDIDMPAIPSGLNATPGNAKVSLAWSAADSAQSYNIKRSSTAGGPYITIATNIVSLSFTDSTAINGSAYYYVVSAVNAAGESQNSSEKSVYLTPDAPANLTAAEGLYKATLSWNAVNGAQSYNIKRAYVPGGPYTTVGTTEGTTYTDTDLLYTMSYYYVVSGVVSGHESYNSNQASVTMTQSSKSYTGNIVPAMTSDTTPTGIASASGHNPYTYPWYAFDGTSNLWWVANSKSVGWLQYEFPTPKIVTCYSFISGENEYGDVVPPVIYNFEASNDGTNWTVLDSRNLLDFWPGQPDFTRVTFEINNQQAYKIYRLRTTATPVPYNYTKMNIVELEMYETLPAIDDLTPDISAKDASYVQGFEFPEAKSVQKINFDLNNITGAVLPVSCTVEGYNEATGQWNSVYNGAVVLGSNELTLSNSQLYKKYKLSLQFNQGSAVSISDFKVYGIR